MIKYVSVLDIGTTGIRMLVGKIGEDGACHIVAKAALNDTNEEQTEKYAYAVDAGEGVTMYSPYTATQRTALEGFIVATFNLTRPEGSTLMNVGSGAYELYSANVSETAYNNYKAGIEGAGFMQAL